MPAEEPTPGELSRRFDALDRGVQDLAKAVARLPTAELVATQQGRITDRVIQLERDLAKALGLIEQLTAALNLEREQRRAELDRIEQTIVDERESRHAEIAAEKARVGTWVRWLLTGVVGAVAAAIAQALGIHVRPGG